MMVKGTFGAFEASLASVEAPSPAAPKLSTGLEDRRPWVAGTRKPAGSIAEPGAVEPASRRAAPRRRIFTRRTCNLGLRQGGGTRQNEEKFSCPARAGKRETKRAVGAIETRGRTREAGDFESQRALEMRWQEP